MTARPLVPTPDGNMATPAVADALWQIDRAFATPRPGVKPWRWLPCGCKTNGEMCVEHDPALAEFWRRNAPGGEFDQAETAADRHCARELAEIRAGIDAELGRFAEAAE